MNQKNYIVISGDFIAYTSLSTEEKKTLEQELMNLFAILEKKFNTYSRLIKGDFLECVVPNPADGLSVALAIKTFIKSLEIEEKVENINAAVAEQSEKISKFSSEGRFYSPLVKSIASKENLSQEEIDSSAACQDRG